MYFIVCLMLCIQKGNVLSSDMVTKPLTYEAFVAAKRSKDMDRRSFFTSKKFKYGSTVSDKTVAVRVCIHNRCYFFVLLHSQ